MRIKGLYPNLLKKVDASVRNAARSLTQRAGFQTIPAGSKKLAFEEAPLQTIVAEDLPCQRTLPQPAHCIIPLRGPPT